MILRISSRVVLIGLLSLSSAAWTQQQFCVTESQIPTSTPTSRFTDHGDGTVTDTQTGLMWAKCQTALTGPTCSAGVYASFNWNDALQSAEASTLAGYSDWRLPNVKELSSIVELRCANPAVNLAVFPNTEAAVAFWSSSPSEANGNSAWFLSSLAGDSQGGRGRHELSVIRLVRTAP
jgi:hypothetical protein